MPAARSSWTSEELQVGNQPYRVEGRILHCRHRGVLTMSEVEGLAALYADHIAQHGALLLLLDLSKSGTLTAEVRRALTDWLRRTGNAARMAIAIYGSGRMQNVMTTLLMSAVRVLTGVTPASRTFADESSARAWLTEQEASGKLPWKSGN